MQTITYSQAKGEYRLMCDSDCWSHAKHWWFTIADEIHFNRPRLAVPDAWRFKPSPLGELNDPDDYATSVVRSMPDDDLARFGTLINRAMQTMRHLGMQHDD